MVVYGMCKAALERFSTGLAAELYYDNIAVNALSPAREYRPQAWSSTTS
jgi:NAD(P)-dependent dehydrogenase (short-subunit alcohol dehydrogenase family)